MRKNHAATTKKAMSWKEVQARLAAGSTALKSRDLWRMLFRKLLLILIGSLIYAISISLFLDPNQLAPGGVSGIAIIISHTCHLDTGLLILLLNVPIMGLGLWKLGWRTMISTMFTVFLTTALIDLAAPLGALTRNPLLAAVYGGGLQALGMAIVFKADSTTGGVDVLVRVLRMRLPHFKSGALFFVADGLVIFVSGLVFRNVDLALYAGLAAILFSLVFDYALYGGDSAKLIYIVSDKHQVIVRRLLQELNLGVTYLSGTGAWSGTEKSVVVCAMKNRLFRQAHQIVLQEDPTAFLIVGQATEVFGEGFKAHDEPIL